MRIAVWKTGHEIADTVAQVAYDGLPNAKLYSTRDARWRSAIRDSDIHICYGILRGASGIFREAEEASRPWFNIDKGYFNPSHYDGNYRVSLGGTQQTFGFSKPIGINSVIEGDPTPVLICPPTDYVAYYFKVNRWNWLDAIQGRYPQTSIHSSSIPYTIREKGCIVPIDECLPNYKKVITFNSSIAWKALELGIPVESDSIHSIVGAYQKVIDFPLHLNGNYRQLFAFMREMQMTLSEMRDGKLWALIQRQLGFLSDMTAEKPSPPMSPPTALENAQNPT